MTHRAGFCAGLSRRIVCALSVLATTGAIVACGTQHIDLLSNGSGGSGGAPSARLEPCLTPGVWLEPEPLTGLAMEALDHAGPALTSNTLTLYYSVGIGDAEDIWQATRELGASAFTNPRAVPELNSTLMDGTPHVTVDGTELWFASERVGGVGDRDIWLAEFGASGLTAPHNVAALNSASLEHLPSLTEDRLLIFFGSDRPGSAVEDIWSASRSSVTEDFGEPVLVTEVNSDNYDSSPSLTPDGLTLYFTSNRAQDAGPDLYMTSRASRDAPFDEPVRLTALNSPAQDADPLLDPAQLEILFATSRASSVSEIWRAQRPCLDP